MSAVVVTSEPYPDSLVKHYFNRPPATMNWKNIIFYYYYIISSGYFSFIMSINAITAFNASNGIATVWFTFRLSLI